MRALAAFLLLFPLLAGCSEGGGADAAGDGKGADVGVSDTTGAIVGLVVDERIMPIEGAEVTLSGGGPPRAATSDGEGRFVFSELPPGTYVLAASSLLHQSAQASVEVAAGVEPPVTKILLSRRFTQDPYHETLKFDGFIQCGYDATVISSLCANDYTRFVTDPQCPQCEHLLGDNRGTDFAVGPGWQVLVYEMTWEPPLQATSERMRLIVSHTPRVASHWYCSGSGANPVQLRMDVGVACEDQQDEPEQVPPEGLPNMHLFAAVDAPEGQFAAATVSQRFTVFMNFFYFGGAPDGWSFINGDEFPF